jgi:hypothetical protein
MDFRVGKTAFDRARHGLRYLAQRTIKPSPSLYAIGPELTSRDVRDLVAIEGKHVNSLVQNVRFALYRDFPDPQRQRGAERF